MFDQLLESKRTQGGEQSRWTMSIAAALHVLVIGAIVGAGYLVVGAVTDPDMMISLIIAAAPPPPPPPPPPPAGPSKPQAKVEVKPTQPDEIVQPEEIPEVVPDLPQMGGDDSGDPDAGEGVPGGVEGGVAGGVPGGVPGGVVGGTGTGPILVTGDVRPPELIDKITPDYPEIARKARMEGRVILQAIINVEGQVEEVTILRSPNELFNDSAVEAVRKWKYKPALQNGQPVAVFFTVIVEFKLH